MSVSSVACVSDSTLNLAVTVIFFPKSSTDPSGMGRGGMERDGIGGGRSMHSASSTINKVEKCCIVCDTSAACMICSDIAWAASGVNSFDKLRLLSRLLYMTSSLA
ncbi:hypothetical protein ACHAW5_002380 [Stephanodiscus triporus]|uniref:Uncharacterized protein n=1 Tax=Stephanodiscus triporus TaxID=2934178 RepID=A0ABD3NVK5_9STRA